MRSDVMLNVHANNHTHVHDKTASTQENNLVLEKTVNAPCKCKVYGNSTQETVTNYVTDNLSIFLDGYGNSAINTHTDNSSAWNDISENSYNLANTGATTDNVSFVLDGTDKLVNTTTKSFTDFTFEVCMYYDKTSHCYDCLSLDNAAGTGIVVYRKNDFENYRFWIKGTDLGSAYAITANKVVTATVTIDNSGNYKVYTDGTLIKSGTVTAGVNGFLSLGVLRNYSTGRIPFVGKFYSVRVYSKVLTDNEVYSNYKIDQIRFNNNTMLTLPNSYKPSVSYSSAIKSTADELNLKSTSVRKTIIN